MIPVIKHITHPETAALYQARLDHATITGQEFVENPWWYEDLENKYLYHDLYGCIGWPSEVADSNHQLPGYIAIVGVLRPSNLDKLEHFDPKDAKFFLIEEFETLDVPTLIAQCLLMREKYGFGLTPSLLDVWYGDPERFVTMLAIMNERLIQQGGDHNALMIAPPDDFYVPHIFDHYVRSLKSCLKPKVPGKKETRRLFFHDRCTTVKTHSKEFYRDDPCVLAVGGLIHTLLNRCMWMGQVDGETVFSVEEVA